MEDGTGDIMRVESGCVQVEVNENTYSFSALLMNANKWLVHRSRTRCLLQMRV